MLFIYTPHDSPRLDYALEFILKESLKVPITLVEHLREVPEGEPLLIYSYNKPEQPAAWIFPHDLPLEFSINEQKVEVFEFNSHPVFFGSGEKGQEGADLPYDPFALVFFMLSRYEEYLPGSRDEHGRFPASLSAAFQNNFLEHPVVDYAVEDVRQLLERKWPALKMQPPDFHVELSYDIDAPFAFYGKSQSKNFAAALLDAVTGRKTGRMAYSLGKRDDPFDIFDSLLDELSDRKLSAFFFLLLEHQGRQNPSIDYRDDRFRKIVEKLGERQALGIHPSYHCNDRDRLAVESKRFQELTGNKPERSRFHFIRMRLPHSYNMIYHSGIFHEHSMAFPDHCGFRAGTSRNYPFYDLSAEVVTDLIIHPFCFMDATFEYYMKGLSGDEIQDNISTITQRIQRTGGKLGWVFHNDLISAYPSRQNWENMHIKVLASLQ